MAAIAIGFLNHNAIGDGEAAMDSGSIGDIAAAAISLLQGCCAQSIRAFSEPV